MCTAPERTPKRIHVLCRRVTRHCFFHPLQTQGILQDQKVCCAWRQKRNTRCGTVSDHRRTCRAKGEAGIRAGICILYSYVNILYYIRMCVREDETKYTVTQLVFSAASSCC